MFNLLETWRERGDHNERKEALTKFGEELGDWQRTSLLALLKDLEQGKVTTGWDGGPLSYKNGFAGSVDTDQNGEVSNAFTRAWRMGIDELDIMPIVERAIEKLDAAWSSEIGAVPPDDAPEEYV